jgi:large subunit ribosomal protein L5
MHDFINRLLYVALPDEKGFNGFSIKNFDGNGNLCFGIKEHIIFPEIDYDKIYKIIGMNVVIVTTAQTNEHGKLLLSYVGFPFID